MKDAGKKKKKKRHEDMEMRKEELGIRSLACVFAAHQKVVKCLLANSVNRPRVDATWISGFVMNELLTMQNRRLNPRGPGHIFPSRRLGLERGAINVGHSGRFLGRCIDLARRCSRVRR